MSTYRRILLVVDLTEHSSAVGRRAYSEISNASARLSSGANRRATPRGRG